MANSSGVGLGQLVRRDERGVWSSIGLLLPQSSERDSPFSTWHQKLMRAVLTQALRDLEKGLDPCTDWEIDLAWEVVEWVRERSYSPFSFDAVLTVCGRDPERLRPLFLAEARRLRPRPNLTTRPLTDWSGTITIEWQEEQLFLVDDLVPAVALHAIPAG